MDFSWLDEIDEVGSPSLCSSSDEGLVPTSANSSTSILGDDDFLDCIDDISFLDDLGDLEGIDLEKLLAAELHSDAQVSNTQQVPVFSTNQGVSIATGSHDQCAQHISSTNEQLKVVIKSTDVIEPPNFRSNSHAEGMIYIDIENQIAVHVQPCPDQHVRYEKDYKKFLRYIKAANDEPITIDVSEISDLWNFCQTNGYNAWMKITRTTVGHSGPILCHPYPIWMKSNKTKVYDGSLYQKISQDNMFNGSIEIENLVMVALKQDELETINELAVYDSAKTIFTERRYTFTINAKEMIEQYNLRQSVLRFQIMLADTNNVLYPTNYCCESVTLTEYRGKKPQQSNSGTAEHVPMGNNAHTDQSVQQIPSSTRKRRASEESTMEPKKAKLSGESISSLKKSDRT